MEITEIRYSALVSLGNYENQKLGLTAEIGPDEDLDEAFEKLRLEVHKRLENEEEFNRFIDVHRRARAQAEEALNRLLAVRAEYEKQKSVFDAAGIKHDLEPLPDLNIPGMQNLSVPCLPSQVSVVEEDHPF